MDYRARHRQKGIAIPLTLGLITILGILISGSVLLTTNSQKQTYREFSRHAQANNVAQAGLQAAIGWFKNQPNQPVTQTPSEADERCSTPTEDDKHLGFFPRENTSNPDLGDTYDENIGLVKEVKVQEPNIYGRYIVRRYKCGESIDSDWNRFAVKDITFEKGKNEGTVFTNQGKVWEIFSEGIVYVKNDPGADPDVAPNRVISKQRASVEINQVSLSVPKAPLSLTGVGSGLKSNFNNDCEIIADGNEDYGVVRNTGTLNYNGSPKFTLPNGSATTNHQINTGLGEEDKTVLNTFNLNVEELKAISDVVYTNVNEMSATEPLKFGITYLDGGGSSTFTFNSARPLRGSGVLFVYGHLNMAADSYSNFTGLVYVTGTATIGESNQIGGSLVAQRVNCQPTNSAIIEFNDNIMTNVRQRLALYRKNALSLNVGLN